MIANGFYNPVATSILPAQEDAYQAFVRDYPGYGDGRELEAWRSREYGRLDATQQIYLDYTGGSLYAVSQLEKHMEILHSHVLGNPHSANPTSQAMTEMVEATRAAILHYFKASPDDYLMVFTANASGALKLVGESYPFQPGGRYLLTFDNHNSVNGIREFARAKGAAFSYAPLTTPELRLDRAHLETALKTADRQQANLFAFPAQSNFSGVKHPLALVEEAQAYGWDVLLDAAAFVPTNLLDLGTIKPQFVTMSFYKMFGYPTGVGALLMRRDMLDKLKRPWFAGGTVSFATVQGEGHYLTASEARFEDGTVNYLSIPAVKIGLQYLEKIGVERIGERVRCLTDWLLQQLLALHHSNGRPIVHLYGPATTEMRGGTIALNFYDPEMGLLEHQHIEAMAGQAGISLRTGCFCNPGAGETAAELTREEMLLGLSGGAEMTLSHFRQIIRQRDHKDVGAIRVSLGIATNFADVYRFVQFAAGLRDQMKLGTDAGSLQARNDVPSSLSENPFS